MLPGRNGMVFPEGRWKSLVQVDFEGPIFSQIPDKKKNTDVFSSVMDWVYVKKLFFIFFTHFMGFAILGRDRKTRLCGEIFFS